MSQIARTALPPNQVFHVALGRIFGLGRATGLEAAEACGISKDMKVCAGLLGSACPCAAPRLLIQAMGVAAVQVRDVKEESLLKVAAHIQENYVVGDQLKRTLRERILGMISMKSYRGSRCGDRGAAVPVGT